MPLNGTLKNITNEITGEPNRQVIGDKISIEECTKRLSLAQCRELIGNKSITDSELEMMRDQLYALANIAIDEFLKINKEKVTQ